MKSHLTCPNTASADAPWWRERHKGRESGLRMSCLLFACGSLLLVLTPNPSATPVPILKSWLRHADLIPSTREKLWAREMSRLESSSLRTSSGLLPGPSRNGSSARIPRSRGFASLLNWRSASGILSLNKDVVGTYSGEVPCDND